MIHFFIPRFNSRSYVRSDWLRKTRNTFRYMIVHFFNAIRNMNISFEYFWHHFFTSTLYPNPFMVTSSNSVQTESLLRRRLIVVFIVSSVQFASEPHTSSSSSVFVKIFPGYERNLYKRSNSLRESKRSEPLYSAVSFS